MSAVLGAFLSTWSNARQTFGQGAPAPGVVFDQSPQLTRLHSEVSSAKPDAVWSGGAANAYGTVNIGRANVIARMAELDQHLAAQVDRSAAIVTAGRQNLDSVRQWVVSAAAMVPPTALGEQMMLPIVEKGLGQVAGIVETSNAELNLVGAEIDRLAGEYTLLGGHTFKQGPAEAPPPTPDEEKRRRLDEILEKYRVREDPGGTHDFDAPAFLDWLNGEEIPTQQLTQTEIEMLLADPTRITTVMDIRDQATAAAKARFPPPNGSEIDNQTDAFRHAYGRALMTQEFGEEWTAVFTAAHEGREANYQSSESMDLYNNQVGRDIALANPDASPQELADLVQQSVSSGDMVVIGPDGKSLEWSDSTLPIGDSSLSSPGPAGAGAPLPSPYPSVGGS